MQKLLPTIVYNLPPEVSSLSINACVVILDICNFTDLTERYVRRANDFSKAADLMSQKINSVLNTAVSVILEYGGDILNFAGDAIMAIWPIEGENDLKQSVENCLRACSIAQERISRSYIDPLDGTIKIKVAISCQNISINVYGRDNL